MHPRPLCRPTASAAAVRGGILDPSNAAARSSLPTCAVVGSADVLRLDTPRGAEIDAHELVWRVNNAPTIGWEERVGRRTSVRVVNHVPIEKWLLRARNRSALAATRDGSEYQSMLCAPDAVEKGCVVSLAGRGHGFGAKLAAYRSAYPSHVLHTMTEALLLYGERCTRELRGTLPSGGLYTVLLALSACAAPVSLYGFWPFCCRAHGGWPVMNYKYSHGNRTRFICCSPGREKMELEYGLYEALAKAKRVRIVMGSPPGTRTAKASTR